MSEVVVSKNATTTPGHAKTLADIVSEIHKIAERFHEDYLSDPVEFEGYERIANEFSTLANEIEEAVKQEHGNAMAMHFALTNILLEMIELGGIERGRRALFSPDAIAHECRDALDVPMRNCDKYATKDKAEEAWWSEEVAPRLANVPMDHAEIPFEDWLFIESSTKTDAKGGAK